MEITTDTQAVLNATLDAFGKSAPFVVETEDSAVRLFCRLFDTIQNLTLGKVPTETLTKNEPDLSALIASSIHDDHIVSLVDGKPYQMLRRHLAKHGLTADAYRAKFGLPSDYPMTAPAYRQKRAAIAKQMGLGTPANRGLVAAPTSKPARAAA